MPVHFYFFFFFFNDTATTEIYTLSLHDALPIWIGSRKSNNSAWTRSSSFRSSISKAGPSSFPSWRSEEHTSELQSRPHLVCRLLLEKKKKIKARAGPQGSECHSIYPPKGSHGAF